MIRGKLTALFRRFSRDNEGVAAVEFALIMPVPADALLRLDGSERLFTADKRVNTISATMGDLVAQWNPDDGTIPTATMATYFSVSERHYFPLHLGGHQAGRVAGLRQSGRDDKGVVELCNWHGCDRANDQPTLFALGDDVDDDQVSRGGCVVAAETIYPYKPLFGQVFKTPLTSGAHQLLRAALRWHRRHQPQTTSLTTTACTTGS